MIKKLLSLLLFCSLISAPFMVSAQHWNEQEGRYYDGHGRYEGRIDSNECTTTTGATKAELTAMAATMMNTVDIKEDVTITGVFTTSQDDTKEESTTAVTTMSTAVI